MDPEAQNLRNLQKSYEISSIPVNISKYFKYNTNDYASSEIAELKSEFTRININPRINHLFMLRQNQKIYEAKNKESVGQADLDKWLIEKTAVLRYKYWYCLMAKNFTCTTLRDQ